ncbi:E3 ubiquitin-protein ligase RNF168-like [Toxorhynchites rutilus septentrionalis]|uniref:E3 ubiquitin-protein ligase RNF168-like n=1 Tax=Toxorhynchites rutilus septentrionalis TaxID=329112 RepID=UPI0024786743|nr:E3 ubiquitin-protein ligase RNF168-like [Toxorhynchites rutilus septentrionalis]
MSSKLLNYPSASTNPHLATGSAAGAAASARGVGHGSSQLNFENLQLDDILCTVCQSVLVEPVFLPCQHRFCRNCLSGTIEKNNLNCPCCRKRFGTWYRNASRVNKLVHEQLWSAIQNQFRDYLEEDGTRCNGNGSAASCFVPQAGTVIHLSEPGEIRKEYESELQRYRKELIEEKKKELAASEKYIINLYKQEGIIDLVDSSDHLSISSSTSTPELEKKPEASQQQNNDEAHEIDEDDEEAGPSGSSTFQPPTTIKKSSTANNQKGNQQHKPPSSTVVSSSSNVNASRPDTSKSVSNGSIISISSTSSASAASSSCISSASSRYSLIKSVAQQNGRGSDVTKQKPQTNSLSNKIASGGGKKSFTMADLNKSELCVKPTKLHRRTSSQAGEDEDDGDDGDSLRSELNHFKPILATTPKSCFSPKAIVRVPSMRPEATGLTPMASIVVSPGPSKTPFKPIDPSSPRRSAFSVVNINLLISSTDKLTTGDRLPKQSETGSTPLKSRKTKTSQRKSIKKPLTGTIRGKRKLKFSPQPNAKAKKSPKKEANPEAIPDKATRSTKTTRLSSRKGSSRLKKLIVSDQQRRQAMIEQERRDFEFAQRLQKKLNRTRGAISLNVQSVPKEVPPPRSQANPYSLRRKTVALVQASNSIKVEPQQSSCRMPSEKPSRKRRTTSLPEPETPLTPVPSTSTAKENSTNKGQPRAKKAKLQSTTAPLKEPRVLRRSTRNRH